MSRPRSSSGKKPKSSYDDSSSFDLSKAETLFNKYCDSDDPEIISMDGISTISEELGIDPTSDVRVLVLFWRLGALSKPGSISKTEFLNGLRQLRKDSIEGLMTILPSLDPGFLDRSEFRGRFHLFNHHCY